jgi:hypothetical protein
MLKQYIVLYRTILPLHAVKGWIAYNLRCVLAANIIGWVVFFAFHTKQKSSISLIVACGGKFFDFDIYFCFSIFLLI